MRKMFVLLMSVLVLLIGCQSSKTNYQDVSIEEAKQMIDQEKVTILDVRTQEEFAEGHIPNATLIPLQELPQKINELDSKQSYLVVCRSGNRSGQASELLSKQGFSKVYNMTGGMSKWDGEVEK